MAKIEFIERPGFQTCVAKMKLVSEDTQGVIWCDRPQGSHLRQVAIFIFKRPDKTGQSIAALRVVGLKINSEPPIVHEPISSHSNLEAATREEVEK
jgi:hypothetical protein